MSLSQYIRLPFAEAFQSCADSGALLAQLCMYDPDQQATIQGLAHQHPERILHRLFDPPEERHCLTAVNNPVIVRQRDVHHRPDNHLVVHGYWALEDPCKHPIKICGHYTETRRIALRQKCTPPGNRVLFHAQFAPKSGTEVMRMH